MRKAWLFVGAATSALVLAAPALAQDSFASDSAAADEEIVVTGRAGASALKKDEASYAITTLDADELRLQNPSSVAEIFKSVPGFWVEASGGEASNNIRARGIPRDGYSSIGLFENGLPVQHDPGLGFLNADQSFRFDETYERVEAVRGGPSAIFASNAPGGLVNFITRRGGDELEGLVKLQVGDYDLYRADAWLGGPISEGWTFSLGGFYRVDDGLRDTQFRANEGGQIRASVSGRLGERGNLFLDVKHLDDSVAFFLPVPLTFDSSGDVAGVPGFDPLEGTFAGRGTNNLTFRSPNGDVPFALDEGTHVDLTQYTAKVDLDLGGGFRLENGFRYRQSDTIRNGLFPATVLPAANRLNALRAGLLTAPGAVDVRLRYAGTGEAFDVANQNGNGLVADATASAVDIVLDEVINDFRILKTLELGGSRHDLAAGLYFSNFDVSFDRFGSTVLLEVNENARRLDLVAVNAAGQVVRSATENGISRYGNQYNNASNSSDVVALFASDEWTISDALRVDLGIRYEELKFNGVVERSANRNLGNAATTADDQVLFGTGVFDRFERRYDDFGFTAGVNYQFTPDAGVYGRYTQTYRLPNATDFLGSATRTDLVKEDIDLAEIGLKYNSRLVDLYLTGFYTFFKGVRFTSTEFNPTTGGFVDRVEFADSETYGVEAEGTMRPVEFFDLSFALTYQKPKFRNFEFTENVGGVPTARNFSGNQLLRVPEFAARVVPAVNLFDDRVRAQLAVEHYSKRFADAANTVELPSYTVLNASVRFAVTDNLEVLAYGDNLTDEIGLTEGNPRAGQFVSGDAGARFYLARPIFGRNFRAAVLYRF